MSKIHLEFRRHDFYALRLINLFVMADQSQLILQSIAFSHGGHIQPLYTCEGKDINPPIEISGIPGDAKSLALIMEDPDAPTGTGADPLPPLQPP